MIDDRKEVEKVNIQRSWMVFILLFVFLVAGCTGTGGEGDIDQAEEKNEEEVEQEQPQISFSIIDFIKFIAEYIKNILFSLFIF